MAPTITPAATIARNQLRCVAVVSWQCWRRGVAAIGWVGICSPGCSLCRGFNPRPRARGRFAKVAAAGGYSNKKLYHVQNGNKGAVLAQYWNGISNNVSDVFILAMRGCLQLVPGYTFTNGFPVGKVGFVSSYMTNGATASASFDSFSVPDDSVWADTGRWMNHSTSTTVTNASGDCYLELSPNWDAVYCPQILKNVRLDSSQEFKVTFSMRQPSWSTTARDVAFLFNVKDQHSFNKISIYHDPTVDPNNRSAPMPREIVNSGREVVISSYTRTPTAMPAAVLTDTVWAQVYWDGNNITVKEIQNNSSEPTDNDWSNASVALTTSSFRNDGGYIGFNRGSGMKIDKLTVKQKVNGNWVTELRDDFTIASGFGQETLTYDPAGNMTYDGMFKFSYDAWNRMVGVKRAWRDYNGSPTNGIYPLAEGSTVATISLPTAGRLRRVKQANDKGHHKRGRLGLHVSLLLRRGLAADGRAKRLGPGDKAVRLGSVVHR